MLHEEALDIGIVRTPLLQSHAATLHTLQRDRFVVALPAGHPLAASTSVSLASLAGEAFVMYSAEEATGLHASAMAACEAAGFVPELRQLATQVPTMLALVEIGLGVALVPEVVRGQRAPQVVYCDLEDNGAGHGSETGLALAWQRGSESPAAQRFLDMISSASGRVPFGGEGPQPRER